MQAVLRSNKSSLSLTAARDDVFLLTGTSVADQPIYRSCGRTSRCALIQYMLSDEVVVRVFLERIRQQRCD
jgi:hypothetical protein